MFSLLPGIRRARDRWPYIVVDWTFTLGGVDLHTHLFINHCRVSFSCLIFAVGLDCEIILTAKFSRSTVHSIYVYSCVNCNSMSIFL